MTQETRPPMLLEHAAVRLEDSIVVFGGYVCNNPNTCIHKSCEPMNAIWVYNLHVDKWRKYDIIHDNKEITGVCGIAIGQDIYVYGCQDRQNMATIWTLTRDRKGCFSWREVLVNKPPSNRRHMAGWEYEKKSWLFGGFGKSPADFGSLNDFVNFDLAIMNRGYNNQLICFDPSSKEWTNLRCSGAVPSPRSHHLSARVGDEVYVFGGRSARSKLHDLCKLGMKHFVWTWIQIINPVPKRYHYSLSAITENKLLFHDGYSPCATWILDLSSLSCKEYKGTMDDHWEEHMGVTGLHGSVIIIGGRSRTESESEFESLIAGGGFDDILLDTGDRSRTFDDVQQEYLLTSCIRLEPQSLQQLAMKAVYENRCPVLWKQLPKSLIQKIMGTSPEEDYTTI